MNYCYYVLMHIARYFAELLGELHHAVGKLAMKAEYHYRLATG